MSCIIQTPLCPALYPARLDAKSKAGLMTGQNNVNWICSMNSLTTLIIGSLVVALCVVGYLYYQRTSSDITIQLPKVSLTK